MSENLAPTLARISEQLVVVHAAIGRIERNQSDPEEIRQALNDVAAGYALITQLAEVAGVQRTQILELTHWIHQRMSGEDLARQFDELLFVTKQLISISQRWRDDLLLMRADVTRLAGMVETTLAAMPNGQAWSGEDRRKAS